MIHIEELHHVSLLVADTRRALAFYHELLGLPLLPRPDLAFPGAWLQLGRVQLHLLELPNPDPVQGRPEHGGRDRHVAVRVGNLDQLMECLQQAGVYCTQSRSGRRALFCCDPDGNGWEFIEDASMSLS